MAFEVMEMDDRFQGIGAKLSELVDHLDGTAGVVVKLLETGQEWSHLPERRFSAASLIKLPILWELYRRAGAGDIDLDHELPVLKEHKVGGTGIIKELHDGLRLTVRDLATLMVVVSDNTATNMLIDLLGFDAINGTIAELGMKGTTLQRKMMDFEAKKQGKDNYTTPGDVAAILEKFALGQGLRKELAREPVDIMLRQQFNNKLPTGLLLCPVCKRNVGDYPQCPWCYTDLKKNPPVGAKLAHKTGELAGTEHDAGILFLDGKTVVIVAMTTDLKSNADGIKFIGEVGSVVAGALT